MQSPLGSGKSHAELYREMLEQVVVAEEIGFDSAWLVEHHFMEDGMCPSLLVTASAMAAHTSRLMIGTSMYLLPLHRPVQTAEDVAVLDNIAAGRFIFGVATGYRPEEYAGHQEQRTGRENRMEEELEILIKSWTTESFSFSGQHYHIDNLSVTPNRTRNHTHRSGSAHQHALAYGVRCNGARLWSRHHGITSMN